MYAQKNNTSLQNRMVLMKNNKLLSRELFLCLKHSLILQKTDFFILFISVNNDRFEEIFSDQYIHKHNVNKLLNNNYT